MDESVFHIHFAGFPGRLHVLLYYLLVLRQMDSDPNILSSSSMDSPLQQVSLAFAGIVAIMIWGMARYFRFSNYSVITCIIYWVLYLLLLSQFVSRVPLLLIEGFHSLLFASGIFPSPASGCGLFACLCPVSGRSEVASKEVSRSVESRVVKTVVVVLEVGRSVYESCLFCSWRRFFAPLTTTLIHSTHNTHSLHSRQGWRKQRRKRRRVTKMKPK